MPMQFGGQISNCRISWFNKNGKGHFVLIKDLKGHPTDISALDSFASHPIPHFVKIEGVFSFKRLTPIVYEYMPVSLAEISGHPSLRDRHLAAILAQLNGQLLGPTEFKGRPPDVTVDLKALCNVAQILMQGYEDSPPRIDRPQRWGDGALAFFNALTKATEIGLLQQVSAATHIYTYMPCANSEHGACVTSGRHAGYTRTPCFRLLNQAMTSKPETIKIARFHDKEFEAHMELLSLNDRSEELNEVSIAPIFMAHVGTHHPDLQRGCSGKTGTLDQHGLLGRDLSTNKASNNDPRVFYNVAAPTSTFICGSQGSGKNTGGLPCEAARLSSHEGVKVRVLCLLTNVMNIKTDLNTKRMLDLMAVNSGQNGRMPLYLHVVARVLRELRIRQQHIGGAFDYRGFKRALEAENLTESQSIPLQQRLETLESFLAKRVSSVPAVADQGNKRKKTKPVASGEEEASDWAPVSGQLTVIDLSCPCVTPEMACSLFNICLGLFLEQETSLGKVVALDESHKYMTDNVESQAFTESLLSTIRLQRHLGVRVIISTQEPTISTRLLDLCSMTVVHRFTSPAWLQVLKGHLAGGSDLSGLNEADDCEGQQHQEATSRRKDTGAVPYPSMSPLALFSNVVQLRTGEALIFSPSAVMDAVQTAHPWAINGTQSGWQAVLLGCGVMKVLVRDRITSDGGRSIMA
ncbi:hypothetical protein MRS44_003851 [Fusarium solani]|uniref:uncharacterized protein n=1 Tax=Fusarium solani TaxID=169388 RepID=UPI0032C48CB7|nr:hypothetical protein MRS44_003851 [Fusarium solani]